MRELTITELEAETVELLPARETLFFNVHNNYAAVWASNSSTALNVLSLGSVAASSANQAVIIGQG